MASDVWTYRDEVKRGKAGIGSPIADVDLAGFSVHARDEDAGKVDRAEYEDGKGFLVVDTGPVVLGKKVLVPASLVRGVDEVAEAVELDLARDELESAPEVEEERLDDEGYRADVARHYTGAA